MSIREKGIRGIAFLAALAVAAACCLALPACAEGTVTVTNEETGETTEYTGFDSLEEAEAWAAAATVIM